MFLAISSTRRDDFTVRYRIGEILSDMNNSKVPISCEIADALHSAVFEIKNLDCSCNINQCLSHSSQ